MVISSIFGSGKGFGQSKEFVSGTDLQHEGYGLVLLLGLWGSVDLIQGTVNSLIYLDVVTCIGRRLCGLVLLNIRRVIGEVHIFSHDWPGLADVRYRR